MQFAILWPTVQPVLFVTDSHLYHLHHLCSRPLYLYYNSQHAPRAARAAATSGRGAASSLPLQHSDSGKPSTGGFSHRVRSDGRWRSRWSSAGGCVSMGNGINKVKSSSVALSLHTHSDTHTGGSKELRVGTGRRHWALQEKSEWEEWKMHWRAKYSICLMLRLR